MLINLQTCTIPYFKGNFIITDLFLYHGWTTVASGAARDENVSLLFFVTPSTMTLVVCNRIVRAMKPPEYNASYLALVHKSFQGDIQLSGPLTLMSCM